MNCCDASGKCVQDDGCPIRTDPFPQVTLEDDEPPLGFDDVMRYIGAFMAGFGMAAFIVVCWLAGLYYGGLR